MTVARMHRRPHVQIRSHGRCFNAPTGIFLFCCAQTDIRREHKRVVVFFFSNHDGRYDDGRKCTILSTGYVRLPIVLSFAHCGLVLVHTSLTMKLLTYFFILFFSGRKVVFASIVRHGTRSSKTHDGIVRLFDWS
jgi:hypothetical protein